MIKKFVILLFVLALVAAGLFMWTRQRIYNHALQPINTPAAVAFTVERGASLKATLQAMQDKGIITRADWVYYFARMAGPAQVRAGEYEAVPTDSPAELLKKMAEGRVRTEQFTVIEGYNRFQIRASLAAAKWMSPAEFDKLCDDKVFLKKYEIPGPSCEGYLFPETYTFARGLGPEQVMGAMFNLFRKVYTQVTTKGTGPLALTQNEFTTLASIVEKETGAPSDRGHIACVFTNRLRENKEKKKNAWRLETDPTVIYAATLADPTFDGNLKRSTLHDLKHPYNTYFVYGLPPGPIASPSRAALEAVARPMACPDFFFVSRNDGTSEFCPTLACHDAAVHKWQVQFFRKQR